MTIENQRKGYSFAILSCFFAGLYIVFIKRMQSDLDPLSLLFWTQCYATLLLSGLLHARGGREKLRRIKKKSWVWLSLLSCLYFVAYWTLFAAIGLLDPTVASFLSRTETLVTIAFGLLFLGEKLNRRELLGGIFLLGGVVLIRYVGGIAFSSGLLLCLVSALFWGIAEGLAKVLVRQVEPLVFAWGRSVLLIPLSGLFLIFSGEGLRLPGTPGIWLGVFCLALAGPVIARFLYLQALTFLPVSKISLINQLQPVCVGFMAWLGLGLLPSAREWIGGAVILVGALLMVNRK